MIMIMIIYIYIYIERERERFYVGLGDSKNTVRWYCLDIPRFEESLKN